jgi:hypothetical protein
MKSNFVLANLFLLDYTDAVFGLFQFTNYLIQGVATPCQILFSKQWFIEYSSDDSKSSDE